ncbi:MAG: leucine-rich repeat domain-containing protein [Myxococcales bacterium]|nr:MAG: leucine-rich repeat domain-containing protein [Myxococcales bacterium]
MELRKFIIVILAGLLLSSCGGSGSSDSDGDTPVFVPDGDGETEEESSPQPDVDPDEAECPPALEVQERADFGAVTHGEESRRRIVVTATREVTVREVVIYDDDEWYEFSILPGEERSCAQTNDNVCHKIELSRHLLEFSTLALDLAYLPKDARLPDDAVLQIETDDSCQPTARVRLFSECKGTYDVAVQVDDEAVGSGDEISFGSLLPDSPSPTKSLVVSNQGGETDNAPVLLGYEFSDDFYAHFDFPDCPANELAEGVLLGIGETKTCTLRLREHSEPGTVEATVTVNWQSSCSGNRPPVSLIFSANIAECPVIVEPNPTLDLGQALLGESAAGQFTIENQCPYVIVWDTCELERGVDFHADCPAGRVLIAEGETKTVAVEFQPTTEGVLSDHLLFSFEREDGTRQQFQRRELVGRGGVCATVGCCPESSDLCLPGQYRCPEEGSYRQRCDEHCGWQSFGECPRRDYCTDEGCLPTPCLEGLRVCDGAIQLACASGAWQEESICDDGNACTFDACTRLSAETDGCTAYPLPDGLPCDDGNPRTTFDACLGGVCLGEDCHCEGIDACCDGCMPLNEGGGCEDGLFCTVGETCQTGLCLGGTERDCSVADGECNTVGCNEEQDACFATPANEGAACQDDGIACTQDLCHSGTCEHPLVPNDCGGLECGPSPSGCHDCGSCDDSEVCTQDVCESGVCHHPPLANDCGELECGPSPTGCFACGACDDADTCTEDVCEAGTCTYSDITNDCGDWICGPSPSGCFNCGECGGGLGCWEGLRCIPTRCLGSLTFADGKLKAAVREAVNKPYGNLYYADVANLTDLDAKDFGIASLDGIECLTDLTTLDFSENALIDLSPLAGLTDLEMLYLTDNQITNAGPLAGLIRLTRLRLDENQITDLSALAGLADLAELYVGSNEISDLGPLQNLTDLTMLSANSNQIVSLNALANLTKLTTLSLYGNQIEDVSPLDVLTALTHLSLSLNAIESLDGLENLRSLTFLELIHNQIQDLSPLAELDQLTFLSLSFNQVANLGPLDGLVGLQQLYLSTNQIVSLSPLTPLVALRVLDLTDNQVLDLSPLVSNAGLGGGDWIDLRGNPFDCGAQAANLQTLNNRGVLIDSDCP